ncbi:hypothetical protein KFZ58_02130 [Virgibacillus sp. NKC19-16]|uniref:hypothetical protein n=1 Tax=Virgibacillus salidurans TaxID=2831673 RepID=UPI001F3D9665|nr:hypothetical protein [Virgibacillus sp. NKC19-16]UJL46775.1 hypothetical protein KFZ58_02130 [Virgibacillus sp. NKC19-16]
MNEQKVYILLTDTGTLFTKMIKLYTRKLYNHASISIDPNFSEVYSFGRKRPKNPFIGGFVKEDIQAGLLEQARCAIYSCTVSETQIQKAHDYLQKIDEQKHNYRYNFLGLFAIAFKKQLKRKNAFFCSQFVATVLKESGIIDFEKALSLVTPHDLENVAGFELVYQGELSNFDAETNNTVHIVTSKDTLPIDIGTMTVQ